MELSDSEKERTDKYVLDLPNTLYSNIILCLILFVTIFYIIIFNNMIDKFTLPEMKIIAAFLFVYSVIKILFIIINKINFEYELREK